MFILYNTSTEEFETFTQSQLFEMLNEDRSQDWSPYDEDSTIKQVKEAVVHFGHPYVIEQDMPFGVKK